MKFNLKLIIIFLITLTSLISIDLQAQNYTFQAHNSLSYVRSILFTDNDKVISVSDDIIVKIWDPFNDWSLVKQFTNGNSSFFNIAILMKDSTLAVSSLGQISIWNIIGSGYLLIKTYNEHTDGIKSFAVSATNILASGSSDTTIKLWDLSMSNSLMTLRGHTSGVYSLVFITNDILASGSQDTFIKIWNLKTAKSLATLIGHTAMVTGLIKMPNNYLVSGSADFSIKIWNLNNNYNLVKTLNGHSDWISAMTQVNEYLVASCANDKTIIIWNVIEFKLVKKISHTTSFRSVNYWPKYDMIIGGLTNGYLIIWYNFLEQDSSTTLKIIETTSLKLESMIETTTILTIISTIVSETAKTIETTNETTTNSLAITTSVGLTTKFDLSSFINLAYSTTKYEILTTNITNEMSTNNNMITNGSTNVKYEIQTTNFDLATQSTPTLSITDYKSQSTTIYQSQYQNQTTPKSDLIAETFISNIFVASNNSNLSTSFSFDTILSPNSLSLNNNSNDNGQLIIGLFTQIKYDLTDCLSNCSHHGLCKLGQNNKMNCECDLFYDGPKCNLNLRPCSKHPCLNSISCKDIILNEMTKQFDFKCECKDKYFGKSCEKKVNLCQNETCSGNGLCKIINENRLNETIKCQCFGIEMYEGEKCEIKSIKLIAIQTTVKSTTYIAISILCSLFLLIVLSDVHNILTKPKTKVKKNCRKIVKKK